MPRPGRGAAGVLVTLALAAIVVVGLARGSGGGSTDRVHSITQRLRCPVCQAESVADSPSATAADMTKLVRQQVRAGRSDQQILAFFRQRYGSWVLLDPPPSGSTLPLWVLPPVVLLAGAAVVGYRHRARAAATPGPSPEAARRPWRERWELALPFEGPGRGALVTAAIAGGLVLAAVLVVRSADQRSPGAAVTGAAPTSSRTLARATTTDLAAAVNANPQVVGMRLALVDRYLSGGDLGDAHSQALTALDLASAPADRAAALKLAGWTTALLGQPSDGATMLQSSLTLQPSDRDTEWFLANVRLVGLHDPTGAATLLENLLASPLDSSRRQVVQERLDQARAQGAPATAP